MKKLKLLSAVLTVLVAACIGGCSENGGKTSGDPAQSAVSSADSAEAESSAENSAQSAPEENSSSPDVSEASDASAASSTPDVLEEDTVDFLVGLDGLSLPRGSIESIFTNDGSECTPEELTEENFSYVVFKDFFYVDNGSAPTRNSIDNADVYDAGTMSFTDIDEAPQKGYKRLKKGDEYNGMTVESAQVGFSSDMTGAYYETADGEEITGGELGLPEIYFSSAEAEFSGSFTLEGYACLVAEDDYGICVGDILFVPTDDSALPKLCCKISPEDGFHYLPRTYSMNGLTWCNEYGYIYLGNISETSADVSMLPDDGSFTKVKVTADSLYVASTVIGNNKMTAELIDMSR